MWTVVGIIIGIFAFVFIVGKPAAQERVEITPATREAVRTNFLKGCTERGGEEIYCGCVANNLSDRLSPEVVDQMVSASKSGESEKFISAYTYGCV